MLPEIRLAFTDDLLRMSDIETLCFSSPWDRDTLTRFLEAPSCRTWTARLDGGIRGYLCACFQSGGLHVVNLAVHPGFRRMGLASALLRMAEEWAERLGAASSVLEVRAGAVAAVELYRRRGYGFDAGLESYYSDGEDGIRMTKSLVPRLETASVAYRLFTECGSVPPVGVVLGSGLSWLAEEFGVGCQMNYSDLLGEHSRHVPGHPGRLACSECGRFVFLLGRRHHYQGYSGSEISALPGILGDMGVRFWILTSSSGAVDPSLSPGDAVLFRDHVNFTGCVPEEGPGRVRPSVYSARLREAAMEASIETGAELREGLFACVSGPAYETSAEIGFLKENGFSTVSMSTVPEALLLSSRGLEVAGLSLVTNAASPGAVLTHEEVLSSQERVRSRQGGFMSAFLRKAASIGLQ